MQDESTTIISIQVGMPQRLRDESGIDQIDPVWTSGIYKESATGPVWITTTGPVGDGQADLNNHGGTEQAVLLYAASHYPAWRSALDRPELAYGGFGENLTVAGMTEDTVCIGDRIEVGEVLLEVSQPRKPCWKLARRNGVADLAQQVQANGRGGWYVRILREGHVEAGQPFTLVDRPFPQWTVTRTNDVMYLRDADRSVRAELAACRALSPRWRKVFDVPVQRRADSAA